jgi:CheY-like chemotaxis protein
MKAQAALFGNVMIIDDSNTDRFLIKQLVLSSNLAENILSYDKPSEAFLYLKNIKETGEGLPDLIFLDLNMPEMNGFQFLDMFRELPKNILRSTKVIIVSSSDSKEDIEKSAEYPNVIKYFIKPLKIMDLAEFIEERSMVYNRARPSF